MNEPSATIEIISSTLIFIGVIAMLIAAVGMLRLPDFYSRNSATTKAVTLGVGFILLGIGIYFNELVIALKITSILLFILLTSPISAHIISRAAFRNGVPFHRKTDLSEVKDRLHEKHIGEEEKSND